MTPEIPTNNIIQDNPKCISHTLQKMLDFILHNKLLQNKNGNLNFLITILHNSFENVKNTIQYSYVTISDE